MINFNKNLAKFLAIGMCLSPVVSKANEVHIGETNINNHAIVFDIEKEGSTKVNLSSFTEDLIISSKDSLVDSLNAALIAGEKELDLLYIEDVEKESLIELQENITLVGGPETLGEKAKLEKASNIYGSDRYETAVEVAEKLGTERGILLVNGLAPSDAIASIPFASMMDFNILLLNEDSIPEVTRTYLENHGKNKEILFVGGLLSLNAEVKQEVLDLVNKEINPEELTISGPNRYETSRELAKKFDNPSSYVLVNGLDDMLAVESSVKASHKSAPLVLINPNSSLESNLNWLEKNPKEIVYLNEIERTDIDFLSSKLENLSILNLDNAILEINDLEKIVKVDSTTEEETVGEVNAEVQVEEPVKVEENHSANSFTTDAGDIIDPDNQTIIFSDGSKARFRQVINMNTTAYNLFPGSSGYTASGTKARRGAVSVDPSVIPLGTRLYITSPDGWTDYGLATAEDTGGAIKGNKLDLFYDSYDTCIQFGRRETVVYVLEDY